MKIVGVVAVMVLLAGPALAQSIQKYGDPDKERTPADVAGDKETERAYRRSLGNIPEQKSTDPWGTMRGDGAPKAAAKASDAKATKPKAKSTDTRTDGAAR
jgi:hypothetical protein